MTCRSSRCTCRYAPGVTLEPSGQPWEDASFLMENPIKDPIQNHSNPMEIYENMMENPIKMDDDPMTKIP